MGIEQHKDLLFEFLQTPLDDGEQILRRFAALPNAVVGQGAKPLQRYVFVPGTRKDAVGWHRCHRADENLVLSQWENTLAELKEFLDKPQHRYRTKLLPHYVRKMKMLAGRPVRVVKRLLAGKT